MTRLKAQRKQQTQLAGTINGGRPEATTGDTVKIEHSGGKYRRIESVEKISGREDLAAEAETAANIPPPSLLSILLASLRLSRCLNTSTWSGPRARG